MAEFILTWNPSKWTMSTAEADEAIERTAQGHEVPGRWSTGGRSSGITVGDCAYLLRQHRDRGIVAQGRFESVVYQDEHWDGSGFDANYADVSWTTWLTTDDRLPTQLLKSQVPGVAWDRLQGSGVRVPERAARDLDVAWYDHLASLGREALFAPEEVLPSARYREGAVRRVEVNRYEREPRARELAIAHHGVDCIVCGFNFGAAYGPIGENFVHVHHVRELSSLPDGYEVDPLTDLVPVCANCHAMLHRQRPALTPDELRQRLEV